MSISGNFFSGLPIHGLAGLLTPNGEPMSNGITLSIDNAREYVLSFLEYSESSIPCQGRVEEKKQNCERLWDEYIVINSRRELIAGRMGDPANALAYAKFRQYSDCMLEYLDIEGMHSLGQAIAVLSVAEADRTDIGRVSLKELEAARDIAVVKFLVYENGIFPDLSRIPGKKGEALSRLARELIEQANGAVLNNWLKERDRH